MMMVQTKNPARMMTLSATIAFTVPDSALHGYGADFGVDGAELFLELVVVGSVYDDPSDDEAWYGPVESCI